MSQSSSQFLKIVVASGMLLCFAGGARAADPHQMEATPSLPPGAISSVCDQLEAASKYTIAANVVAHATTVQDPISIASCLNQLIQDYQQLSDMFSNGFSFSVVLNSFSSAGTNSLISDLEKKACSDASGILHSVQNGLVLSTSTTNIMGSVGGVGIQASVSVGGSSSSGTGSGGSSSGATSSSSSGSMDPATAGSAYDDLDVVANSDGVTLTEHSYPSITPSTLSFNDDANGTSGNYANGEGNDSPTPVPIPYDNPAVAPGNATVCVPPNNRSDIPKDESTRAGDDPWSFIGETSAQASADSQSLNDQETMQPASTIVPTGNTPSTDGSKQSQNPAGVDGVPACSSSVEPQGSPGYTSTGMPCTANGKPSCMAGTGSACSSQNGDIGTAKDYQTGAMFGHAAYDSGGNLGQCAALTQKEVPNIGNTGSWQPGQFVQGNASLQFGTAVATFFGPASGGVGQGTAYKYEPGNNVHNQHTGIYMGQGKNQMYLMEQFHSKSSPDAKNGIVNPHLSPYKWGTKWTPGSPVKDKTPEKQGANYRVICVSGHGCS